MTQVSKIDLKKIIARNRKVDPEKLAEILAVLKELRHRGFKYSEYELTPPFSRRIPTFTEDETVDSRSVYLRSFED